MQSQDNLHHSGEGRRPAFRKLRRGHQSGFIQTLELLLILAVFGTVFYFALELFHTWLVQSIDPMGGKNVIVYDSTGSYITRTNSFVGHEAPHLVSRVDTNEAAILGVRAETNGGFTTRQRLYFSDSTNCTGMIMWILDPTTAAGAATQFLEWDNTTGISPLPSGVGYGHPISDYYTLQTIAFAMGPNGILYRAHGSESTAPPLPPGYDPTILGYPASEWDSERYDAGRCRQIGDVTSLAPCGPGCGANPEQVALVPHLMQVDNAYTVNDKNGIPFAPMFWTPTAVNPNPPPVVIGNTNLIVNAPTDESGAPQGTSPVTFTDADGLVHTLPGAEDQAP